MQSLLSSRLATVRPITTTASLAEFQRFLLGQIDQLQKSSITGKSTSNVVAVQNSEGPLKESIINFYIQERAAQKGKNIELIALEVTHLKENHIYMKQCIEDTIRLFYTEFMAQVQNLSSEMTRLQHENSHLKTKLKEMSKLNKQLAEQNKQLRKDLIQWQQAKQRRRSKQQRKEEPSIEKIQQLIQKKIVKQDILTHMTPLKQFNMQTFMNRKVPSFNFATSIAQNKSTTNTDKKFRTSSISDAKHLNQFSSIDIGQGFDRDNTRRKSKQKLKVFSIDP